MLNIKECVGIQVYKKDGKSLKTLHYIEPFPDVDCQGMKVGTIFIGEKNFNIKVGDKFQALYDLGQKYDNVTKQWSNIPILAEIQIIDKK